MPEREILQGVVVLACELEAALFFLKWLLELYALKAPGIINIPLQSASRSSSKALQSASHWAFKAFYAKSRLTVFVECIMEKAFEQWPIQKRPSSHSADIRPEVGNGTTLTPVQALSDINEQYIPPWGKKRRENIQVVFPCTSVSKSFKHVPHN
jgi:hypothetical protein